MLKNYLKVALRTLRRHPAYAAINVLGLAVGLASVVLIALWVGDELRYDRFHENADLTVRIVFDGQIPNAPPDRFAVTSPPIAPALRSFPEVEAVTRLEPWDPVLRVGGRYATGDTYYAVDPGFFDVFTFPLVAGDPETALAAPYSLVVTEDMAERHFGSADVLGRSVVLNDSLTFTVTGVAADVPTHSHLDFDALTSRSTFDSFPDREEESEAWLNMNLYTYATLREGADRAAFRAKLAPLINDGMGEDLAQMGMTTELVAQPLGNIYLHSDRGAEIGPTGDSATVWAFSAIALFVLVLAVVNFINLATARSLDRAKEVGVRKTIGSGRGALVGQFLAEAVVIAGFALVVAAGLVAVALPFFNDVAGKDLGLGVFLSPVVVGALLLLTVGVGLLAGAYPAFVLSGFRPAEVLKGTFRSGGRGVRLRQGLVVLQFAVTTALIVGTLVVFQQLDYMKSQRLGFEKERVLVLDARGLPNGLLGQKLDVAKEAFREVPAVRSVAVSNQVPGRGTWVLIYRPEGVPEDETRRIQMVPVDHDYLATLGIELVAGRDFSPDFETEPVGGVLVNEAAVANAGWGTPEQAVGKTLEFGDGEPVPVVGVFRDYHHTSLRQAIEPLALRFMPGFGNYVSVRLSTDEAPATIEALEQAWAEVFPGHTFDYFFLDTDYDNQYAAEARLTQIFGAFAVLAIIVACLGLFGLAAFVTAQRTKEIGVRKVLGASVLQIVVLLAKDFLALVAVAVVLAAPLAWFGLDRWLDDFAYRVELGPWLFLLGGLVALVVALATVSWKALRAATADPVRSLRYE
jgi:putative ABC transport system permease protein